MWFVRGRVEYVGLGLVPRAFDRSTDGGWADAIYYLSRRYGAPVYDLTKASGLDCLFDGASVSECLAREGDEITAQFSCRGGDVSADAVRIGDVVIVVVRYRSPRGAAAAMRIDSAL